jgi:phospholipid/cholesterol/gamma-HCH transport system permease protein
LGELGRWSVLQGGHAEAAVGFLGGIVRVLGEAVLRPRALRVSSLARHIYETGITAIPIVSLIAFLISVIVAYLGAQQLSRFGADIFVVDLVTISVLREMGVLLTAIIVAGRSGSAFAAEIGVMQLNEETDALRAMGMSPIELLVVPRVLALVIAMPLLTIIADAMGLAGGGLLSLLNLHIPLVQFTYRLREALSPTTFWAGLIKAPIFAILIALVGTYRGMQVQESARELGRLTTVAVVQSIFMVILADALFAVLFVKLKF